MASELIGLRSTTVPSVVVNKYIPPFYKKNGICSLILLAFTHHCSGKV